LHILKIFSRVVVAVAILDNNHNNYVVPCIVVVTNHIIMPNQLLREAGHPAATMDFNKRRRESSWLFDSFECSSSSSSKHTLSSTSSSSTDITYEQMYEYYNYSTVYRPQQARIANNFFFSNNGVK
jgi:hypothetical protein